MAIYNPAAFDQYMHNSIDAITLASTVTTNINNLTQSDLQLYLNQFITHLATIDSNAPTLFQHFATPFVADTYAMAIENHLAKLGAYLFAADPLNSNENRIDTIGELGTRLNTVSDMMRAACTSNYSPVMPSQQSNLILTMTLIAASLVVC